MLRPIIFFRKPIPGYHSIEELFQTVKKYLPADIDPQEKVVPYKSVRLFARLFNTWFAFREKGLVNHITGDVHYIALMLPPGRTILTIHDLEIIKRSRGPKRLMILLFWYILPARRAKYITVISEFTRNELLQQIKIPAEKIKIIPNCISESITYSPGTFNSGCPLVLQVGTKDNKNIPNLIKALKDITCKLVILGVPSKDHLRLLKKYHIEYENYQGLSYCEVLELYKKADMLAFVSTYEGFGLPILEAQATGRVVITSNCSSMPEVAGDGALLVDPFHVKSIREGILKLIDDASLRESLICKGLTNVQRYRPAAVAGQYAALYREIAGVHAPEADTEEE